MPYTNKGRPKKPDNASEWYAYVGSHSSPLKRKTAQANLAKGRAIRKANLARKAAFPDIPIPPTL